MQTWNIWKPMILKYFQTSASLDSIFNTKKNTGNKFRHSN